MAYTLSPLDEAIMTETLVNEQQRIEAFARSWRAYHGVFQKPLKRSKSGYDDNIVVNRIKPIVAASVSFLFGKPPTLEIPKEVDGENSTKDSPLEVWLKELQRRNTWPAFLNDLGTNGAVCGTPYARIVPNKDEPEYPRWQVLDPACMRIVWHPRDIDEVLQYIWTYNSFDPQTRRPRVDRQRVVKQDSGTWLIIDEHSRSYSSGNGYNSGLSNVYSDQWTAGDTSALLINGPSSLDGWERTGEEEWPYEWAPIIHCKNLPAPNEVYGAPDFTLTEIKNNDALNFNLSNRQRIDRLHSHPWRWVKGMMGQKLTIDPEVVTDIPNPAGEVGQLEPKIDSQAPAQLGREIYESILEATQTPSIVLGREDATSNPSGVALRVKLWPLVNKTEQKQVFYGPMLVELIRRTTELAKSRKDVVCKLQWTDVIPIDKLQEGQLYLLDSQMGIASKATLAAKRGYEFDTELENMKKEAEEALEQQKAQMEMQAEFAPPPMAGPGGAAAPGKPKVMPKTQSAQRRVRDQGQPARKPLGQSK